MFTDRDVQSGIISNSTASKIPLSLMHFNVYKTIDNNKNNCLYLYIKFTSFESWTIYVIYIVILIGFLQCRLERIRIEFCARHFGQFLSDVNTDVNGNMPFLKFPLNLNWCIWEDRYLIFIEVIYFGHASFTFPIITEHQYFLYYVTQY